MISPALFAMQSYDEMVDTLRRGVIVESMAALIRLKPIDQGTFRIAELFMSDKNTLHEREIEVSFRLTVSDLKRVIGSASKQHFEAGDFDGFQVVDPEGKSVTDNNSDVYSYDDAVEILNNAGKEADLVPIPKGRADILKYMGPVFDEIEVLANISSGNYDMHYGFNESHVKIADYGLKVVSAMEEMGQALHAEKAKNRRAQKIRDAGDDVVTMSQSEYDDLFKHAATLKSILEFSEFNQEIRQTLEAVEVPDLDESGQFDPLTLLENRGSY